MQNLTLSKSSEGPFKILCLGAHCDDIEIGCGGTILRLADEIPDLHVVWTVFAAQGNRADEAHTSATQFLADAKEKEIILKNFRDGYFPYIGDEVKDYFESLKEAFTPDLIFTHYREDLHQDHRLICELTWNTFRDHLILEYEIPKYDGDLGSPNFFIPLNEPVCQRKVDNLILFFPSQKSRHWFSEDTFFALLRLRGLESKSPTKFAEAFYTRKIVMEKQV